MENPVITVVVHNGLGNRLLPLLSCLRLAQKSNRRLNVIFNGTPVRSCLTYYGENCKFEDLFENHEEICIISNEENSSIVYNKTFYFEYWYKKDMIIDISGNENIFTNYGLYTIISEKDDLSSIFVKLQKIICEPCELTFDYIGEELGDCFRTLKPVKDLQCEIDKYKQKFHRNMIGFHIRSSDGGFLNIKWDKIVKKIISICKKWCSLSKDNGVFLATDNPKYYVDFVCSLNQFVFYDPPDVLCNTKSSTKFNNDKYNVLCALVEIHLLGNCNHTIVGTVDSTFSICSMLLADNKTKKYLVNDVSNIPEII
jgi:hypothetical protein